MLCFSTFSQTWRCLGRICPDLTRSARQSSMMSTILTLEGQRLSQSAQVVQVYMFSTTESSGRRSPVSRP